MVESDWQLTDPLYPAGTPIFSLAGGLAWR